MLEMCEETAGGRGKKKKPEWVGAIWEVGWDQEGRRGCTVHVRVQYGVRTKKGTTGCVQAKGPRLSSADKLQS